MINELIYRLKTEKIYIASIDQMSEILSQVETVKENETYFRDKIRILKSEDTYLIQEQTRKNELVFRRMDSFEDAKKFVNQRLETYENMWNGCGCRVDYYS